MQMSEIVRGACAIGTVLAWDIATCLAAGPAGTPDPSTYLYDMAPASALPLAEQWRPTASGEPSLDEDDTAHRFRGSPVLVNDRIVAVLRPGTAELDVYCRTAQGVRHCARLQPVCDGTGELKPTSLAIKENSRTCAAIEVEFHTPRGTTGQITYTLTAGGPFIKTTARAGVEKLRVHAPCRFAVLPDFFGDDIVVDAAAIPVVQAELPSENFLLHLLPGGETVLMTVSESRDNDIGITLSGTGPRELVAADISYGKKPHVWVAVLAGPGIWHHHTVAPEDAGKTIGLEWQMPFPALWRVDWSSVDQLTDSWEMLLQQPDGKHVMQGWFDQDEAVGQRFGPEFGARDWNKPGRMRWNPVLGSFAFPCWVDADGRGYLQPLKTRRDSERGPVVNFAGPVIIYPLDRTKAAPLATPLEQLTIVDLVRLTLGVGPCQYILDLEGQKRNVRGEATCYARDIINAIYKEGTQRQNGPVIEEHLDAAVAFIRNVRERIDLYVAFGHALAAYLTEQKRLQPAHARFFDECLELTARLDQYYEQNREKIHTPTYAQEAADQFRQRLLTYTGPDAAQQCATQMAVFTSIGGAQDGLVASCRMIVKTLRQRAGIAMAVQPELKAVGTEIRARTQVILRNPTPYEAPRH